MFRTYGVVTAGVLVLAAAGRAADDTALDAGALGAPVGQVQSVEQPEPLPAPMGVTTDKRAAADKAASTEGPATPATPAAPAVVTSEAGPGCGGGCAGCGSCGRGCLEHFWDWLTYQPLNRAGCCGCGHGCVPCCNPPLYTFFPCYGCSFFDYSHGCGGCASCGDGGCAGGGCAGGHCLMAHLRGVFHSGQ